MTPLRWIILIAACVPVVLFLLAMAIQALLIRIFCGDCDEGAQADAATPPARKSTPKTYSPEALRNARRRGLNAGLRGHPRTSCPYHQQTDQGLVREWNEGYTIWQARGNGTRPALPWMQQREGGNDGSNNGGAQSRASKSSGRPQAEA
jgi:ribosome modulation factor